MKLYCKDGIVLATHEDAQDVPASAYGDGVTIVYGQGEPGGPAPSQDLDAAKAAAKKAIDAAAEEARQRYITPGAGQAMTYQAKSAELARYDTDTNPVKADYPFLSAEIGVTAPSLSAVADVVREALAGWTIVGGAIERARLKAKAGVDAAKTAQEANAIAGKVEWP